MADLCERHGVRVISDESIWIWFGASSRIFPGVMWRARLGVANVGIKKFQYSRPDRSYGIIENSSSRDAYLSALKGVMGFLPLRYWR